MVTNEHDTHHTGEDAVLKIPSANVEVPITNVSWTRDVNTTEVQHNNSLKASIAVTGLRYSGSFEYEGKNDAVRSAVWKDTTNTLDEKHHPERVTISVKEDVSPEHGGSASTRKVKFLNAVITSESRDIPGDDATSTSYDFVAENIQVQTNV